VKIGPTKGAEAQQWKARGIRAVAYDGEAVVELHTERRLAGKCVSHRTGESITARLSPFAPRKGRSFAERKTTFFDSPVLTWFVRVQPNVAGEQRRLFAVHGHRVVQVELLRLQAGPLCELLPVNHKAVTASVRRMTDAQPKIQNRRGVRIVT